MTYEIGQEVIIKHNKKYQWQLDTDRVYVITETYIDTSVPELGEVERFRIKDLWFNIDEIIPVTKEEYPEYYL